MNRFQLSLITLLLISAMSIAALAEQDNRWTGFYDQQTLAYWQTQMPPGIKENFNELIMPRLTKEERKALSDVTLRFPLEIGSHPMNFYASREDKTVVMPISSMRFFGDVALAYVWLQENKYSIDPVSDYLMMIKWQWPERLAGNAYRPLDVLGIPKSARTNERVMEKYDAIFQNAVFFLLCHELGHHYQYYQWQVLGRQPAPQLRQEVMADQFALDMLRRIGATPAGLSFYFYAAAHFEPNGGDAEYAVKMPEVTHPITSSRIQAITKLLTQQIADFTRTGTSATTIHNLISQINKVVEYLDDPGLQFILRQKGFTGLPELLGPRRPGDIIPQSFYTIASPQMPYSGRYRAHWLNTAETSFDGIMNFKRDGNKVSGTFTFEVENVTAGNVTLWGIVKGDQLFYKWSWGPSYFGKGILKANPTGNTLEGSWGYTEAESGAGRWKLQRMN